MKLRTGAAILPLREGGATSHALRFSDIACLCSAESQCRACSGRGRQLPTGFDTHCVRVVTLEVVERDPGGYVGRHRSVWSEGC